VLSAAAGTALAVPAASADVRAQIRVATPSGTLFQAPLVGAARSYRADGGGTYALPRDTALGQLVAAGAFFARPALIHQDPSLGAFVSAVGGVRPGPKGFWAFFVNDRLAGVGAGAYRLHRGDEVTWILDPDYTKPGPDFLDLDVVAQGPLRARFRVTRVAARGSGYVRVPAAGARLVVGGQTFRVPASGVVRATFIRHGAWTATAATRGAIGSETLVGTV
jgi:hypothetical protein